MGSWLLARRGEPGPLAGFGSPDDSPDSLTGKSKIARELEEIMARKFVVEGRNYDDPDPKLTLDQVRQQLQAFFPDLVNAEVREEKKDEDQIYVFEKRVGVKGRRA